MTCREVPPGNGFCDMCAAGRYEKCRYVSDEHPVDILHDLCERTVGPDKVDHKSFEEAKRSFDAMAKHFSKPIQIPDEWITW